MGNQNLLAIKAIEHAAGWFDDLAIAGSSELRRAATAIGMLGQLIDMAVVYSLISYLYSSIALIRLRKAGEPGAMPFQALALRCHGREARPLLAETSDTAGRS